MARTTKKDAAAKGAKEAAPQGALPLFYKRPVPLQVSRHKGWSLKSDAGFAFSAGANSVPINGNEFAIAGRHYPILFAPGDQPFPIALLGLRQDQNLYVPEYIRRYPFIFFTQTESDKLILCVDEDSDMMVDGDENPFFTGEDQSDMTKKALEFCAGYQQRHEAPIAFTKATQDADLMSERGANVTLRTGETLNVRGFNVIDAEKFDALDDATLLTWRKRGWLPLVYLHLASRNAWGDLVDLAAEAASGTTPKKA